MKFKQLLLHHALSSEISFQPQTQSKAQGINKIKTHVDQNRRKYLPKPQKL